MKQYLEQLKNILENGNKKSDRTGTGTISTFGIQMRFNLEETFPLLTTKKLFTRGIFEELLWFIQGDTSNRNLKNKGVRIWDEWADSNGDLGKIYSAQWRYVLSENKPCILVDKKEATPIDITYDEPKTLDVTSNLKVYKLWERIVNSCHTPSYAYAFSKITATVHPNWHIYENFLADISKVKGYAHWIKHPKKYVLDPNYYGANQYGLETCIFVPKDMQNYDNNAIEFNGVAYKNLDEVKINTSGINFTPSHDVMSYLFPDRNPPIFNTHVIKQAKVNGYESLKFLKAPEGKVYRNEIWIDQLDNLIKTIKNNPDSRRAIVCSWNVAELDDMALPPCHTLFQFYVADGKLSCQLYQRSGDMFLGIPFNIASYSLLTCMVAKECDLNPYEFVHTIGDAHIYLNHIEQCKLQLSRECKQLPTLKLNYDAKDKSIWDVKLKDIVIEGYDPHPTIKGEVSV